MIVVGITAYLIELQWTEIPEEHRNGVITGYIIDYSSSRDNGSITVDLVLEHRLSVLPYTNYTLKVAAVNSAGQGPFSLSVPVHTIAIRKHRVDA